MKKIGTLFIGLLFAFGGFAQTAKVDGSQAELEKNLVANTLTLVMPSEVATETIKKSATYYTDYFSVKYNEGNHQALLTFVDPSKIDISRRVVTRFLLSCGVRSVDFDGKSYTIMQFYDTFLK